VAVFCPKPAYQTVSVPLKHEKMSCRVMRPAGTLFAQYKFYCFY
jgi:hypothetical protein